MRTISITAAALLLLCLVSCSRTLPRTPAEAFRMTAAAVESKDESRLYELLSKQSRESLARAAKTAGLMSGEQKDSLSKKGVLSAGRTDPRAILKAWMEHETPDPALAAFRRSVLTIEEKNGAAKVRLDNGIELRFEKEGLYWKFAL